VQSLADDIGNPLDLAHHRQYATPVVGTNEPKSTAAVDRASAVDRLSMKSLSPGLLLTRYIPPTKMDWRSRFEIGMIATRHSRRAQGAALQARRFDMLGNALKRSVADGATNTEACMVVEVISLTATYEPVETDGYCVYQLHDFAVVPLSFRDVEHRSNVMPRVQPILTTGVFEPIGLSQV
jgi:hypothetical protein